MRVPKFDPEFEARVARYRTVPNIHVDTTSFNLIDQTYIKGADLYLGDGSSQVVEFVEQPRPVVLLDPDRIAWEEDPRFSHWGLGQVVASVADLDRALTEAPGIHHRFASDQRRYVERMMGADDGLASERAADVTIAVAARARELGVPADDERKVPKSHG